LVLFGKQLRQLRESRNLSQDRLAEICGFDRHYVGRIERAERVISFEGMMRLAFGLGVQPAELYQLIPPPKRLPKKGEYKGEKKSASAVSKG
jgi:transcriptional regulator with XRE-family HTH domain